MKTKVFYVFGFSLIAMTDKLKLRFWSEFLKPESLTDEYLRLLGDYSIQVGFAIQKGLLNSKHEELFRKMEKYDVKLCAWPLLTEEEGYWANVQNVKLFSKYFSRRTYPDHE